MQLPQHSLGLVISVPGDSVHLGGGIANPHPGAPELADISGRRNKEWKDGIRSQWFPGLRASVKISFGTRGCGGQVTRG